MVTIRNFQVTILCNFFFKCQNFVRKCYLIPKTSNDFFNPIILCLNTQNKFFFQESHNLFTFLKFSSKSQLPQTTISWCNKSQCYFNNKKNSFLYIMHQQQQYNNNSSKMMEHLLLRINRWSSAFNRECKTGNHNSYT